MPKNNETPRRHPQRGRGPKPVRVFGEHWREDDREGMRRLLSSEARLVADGGGLRGIPQHEVLGAEFVVAALIAIQEHLGVDSLEDASVNGAAGLVMRSAGRVTAVVSVADANERIDHVWVIANPTKLIDWNRHDTR